MNILCRLFAFLFHHPTTNMNKRLRFVVHVIFCNLYLAEKGTNKYVHNTTYINIRLGSILCTYLQH